MERPVPFPADIRAKIRKSAVVNRPTERTHGCRSRSAISSGVKSALSPNVLAEVTFLLITSQSLFTKLSSALHIEFASE